MDTPPPRRFRHPDVVRLIDEAIREVRANPDPLAAGRRLASMYHDRPEPDNKVPWRETYFTLALEGNIHCVRALAFSGERLATNKVLGAIFDGTLPLDLSLWALDFYLRKGFKHAIPAASAFLRRSDATDEEKTAISGLMSLVIAGRPAGLPYGF